jgi:hypothetical protein
MESRSLFVTPKLLWEVDSIYKAANWVLCVIPVP